MSITRRQWMAAASLLAASGPGMAWADANAATGPIRRGGRPWRIGYAESLAFRNFTGTLAGLVQALSRSGWMGDVRGLPYAANATDAATMWRWLAAQPRDFIEWVPDAFYPALSEADPQPILSRLQAGDLDLMLVMGTAAGQKLATSAHRTPTLVFSATNPIAAGFARSETDSGMDHVWAHMDLSRTRRQLRIFHDTCRFRTLGVTFENSDGGRGVASIPQVEEMARSLGFTLRQRHVQRPANVRNPADMRVYYEQLARAWGELSTEVDAMYLAFGQWELDRLHTLLQPFIDRKVPTFSQSGQEEVERGALMSMARANFLGIGTFGAATLARVFHGARPRSLPQVYFDTPTIAMNVEVADLIGFKIPFEALLSADTIYPKILRTST